MSGSEQAQQHTMECLLCHPAGSLTAELTHVVYTCDTSDTGKIYLNGQLVETKTVDGSFSPWQDYFLALANEITQTRPWLGQFYLVAIFDQALSQDDVIQNFNAGP